MSHDHTASQPEIVAARALIDEALVGTREIAHEEISAEAVAERLSEALQRVYAALASLDDAHAFRDACAQSAEHLRGALELLQRGSVSDRAVDAVTSHAAASLRLVLTAPLPVLPRAPWLPRADEARPTVRATLDEPRLLDLQRDVLRPMVPLPESAPPEEEERVTAVPPEPARNLDALAEQARAMLRALDVDDDEAPITDVPQAPPEPPAPFDPARAAERSFGERLTAMDVLFDRARGCLEDLGALGLARRPMEFESWWCPRTEARLLARIDALAACGDAVVPWLVRLLEERPVPDPELTWATVLFFACVAGDDAIDQSMRIARVTPVDEDPELRDSLADAFTHAPHPSVVDQLSPWLADPSPARRVVALVALGRRGMIPLDTLVAALSDGDASVVRAAVDALAVTPDAVPERALSPMLSHSDGAVVGATLDALVRRGSDLALRFATDCVREDRCERGDAAMHVAIGAGSDGLATLHGRGALTPARCEAMGWYGHAASVEPLLVALGGDHEATRKAAAEALWRITGAPVSDEDPAPDLDETPFAEAVFSDDVLPDRPEALSLDAAVWRAWLSRHAQRIDLAARWRYGRRWRVADCVRVLASQASVPRDRRWASLELAARTGRRLPFDAWRFLTRQREQIEAWRRCVEGRFDESPWRTQREAR